MLFQFDIFEIIYILDFSIVLLQVIAFCGLIIFGISRTRNSDTINKSVVFPIVGIIGIIYLAINERIFRLILGLVHYYTIELLMTEYALRGLIPNIISLITFGALFLLLGIKNKENFGKLLMFSGIFWIVFGVIIIAFNSIMISTYIPPPIPVELYRVSLFMPSIASIFMVTSTVFFLIYAVKVDVKILLFPSICLLGASCIFAANSLIQLINFFV